MGGTQSSRVTSCTSSRAARCAQRMRALTPPRPLAVGALPPQRLAPGYVAQALAVLAVMFELSDDCDNDLAQFWDAFPLELGAAAPLKTATAAYLSTSFVKPLLKTGHFHWR